MGESACLLRSFSHPSSASREAKEGNPILALTESISFGTFMSESLAWEKCFPNQWNVAWTPTFVSMLFNERGNEGNEGNYSGMRVE
ncbi:TPX2 (TARGETING PROTEIN FOR XKLP2) PROTEIN FAMILY [Salix purpurea]|uniref:TPX2 (TARGETING PROTEIN FOR XKLP2) PROTEIN FAMILY n=1 Tax=Salix purpurea TaxID=77065 RepID=A0A9Q0TXN8_SALPP|nr:TPX2 (TARGETING PROTEIN FOR XKLP2) PROTEIN FAMILY [Salix purpurea]